MALYANALRNDLVWDDRLTALHAAAHPAAALTERTGSYYRPLVMLSFALDARLWGGAAAGFHFTNVACHVAVAALVGTLAAAVRLGAGPALASALVFVAHPVQTEAVTYVSGRTDVLCALFVLLGLLAWRRAGTATDRYAFAATGAFAAALFCKEAAVAVPLALWLPGAHPGDRPPRPVLPLGVTMLCLAAWAVVGGPLVHASGLAGRLPAIADAAVGLARVLVWPVDLHLERFVPVHGWSPSHAVLACALGLVLVVRARRVPAGAFFLALAVLAYAPVSGVVPVYPAIADRALFTAEHFLYLPLVGLVPLLVGGIARTWPVGAARLGPAVLVGLLLAWGAIVVDRNRDWRDEETIYRHTLRWNPPAARVWYNTGNLALAAGRLDEAERSYRAALAREPHDAAAHLNLGITLQRAGRRAEAAEEYRAAAAADPRLFEASRVRSP